MKKSYLHAIMKYEFQLEFAAGKVAFNINDVFTTHIVNERTLLQQFHTGNFELTNQPRGRPESAVGQ